MRSKAIVIVGAILVSPFVAERPAWAAEPVEPFSLWVAFQEGGWGMWWLLGLGAVSFLSALRFAWRGEHQWVPFLKWMIVTELFVGGFGFLSGMTLVFRYVIERVAPEERWWVLFIGTREALTNLTFALLCSALTALTIAVGYRRFPELNPGVLLNARD